MDSLDQYKLTDAEREEILYSVLITIRWAERKWVPLFIKKYKQKCYTKINRIYDDNRCVYNALVVLVEMRFVDFNNKKTYVTNRGKEALKRGWVYKNCKWYNTPKATKTAVIISLFALLLSIVQFIVGIC